MKKIILTIAIAFSINAGFAQTALQKAQTAAQTGQAVATAFGVDASAVNAKLNSALGLNTLQKAKVAASVATFAKEKSSILSLAKTDKTAYTSKLSGLQSTLTSSLKSSLTAAQFTKYLGLKPATADAANVLTSLFY